MKDLQCQNLTNYYQIITAIQKYTTMYKIPKTIQYQSDDLIETTFERVKILIIDLDIDH